MVTVYCCVSIVLSSILQSYFYKNVPAVQNPYNIFTHMSYLTSKIHVNFQQPSNSQQTTIINELSPAVCCCGLTEIYCCNPGLYVNVIQHIQHFSRVEFYTYNSTFSGWQNRNNTNHRRTSPAVERWISTLFTWSLLPSSASASSLHGAENQVISAFGPFSSE